MKLFIIIIIGLLVAATGQYTSTKATKCPLLPCAFCQPHGNIDFGTTPPCHGCECNPCQYGQPLLNVKCAQGNSKCAAVKGLCKINSADRPYCCPNEREGCCPPPSSKPGICIARCTDDYDCKVGQKCCGNCPRLCVNVTST